jgi:release factor glutamine methyltransferase
MSLKTASSPLRPGSRKTIGALLESSDCLKCISDSPELDVALLLGNVLDCSRAAVLAHPERALDSVQRQKFDLSLQRRRRGEPIAYILGKKAFWDFELKVDSRVLIPRPETELLVEQALDRLSGREQEKLRLLDLGTGSGAIAIALARHSSWWQVVATDQSGASLKLAAENASRLGAGNVEFVQGSWLEPLAGCSFDLIVSNPPYIAPSDPHLQAHGLPFEPAEALVAADEGFACLLEIMRQARNHLNSNAWLLLEHGSTQGAALAAELAESGYQEVTGWQDLAGLDRVTAARLDR